MQSSELTLAKELTDRINRTLPAANEILLWWLGQSGFLIRSCECCVVLDPYLSTTLEDATLHQPWKRHIRMMPIPVVPEEITGVDYIICSHGHRDHCDQVSIETLRQGSPRARVIVPPAVRAEKKWLQNDSTIPVGTDDFFEDHAFQLSSIPAKHNAFDWTEEYGYPYVGYILRFGSYTVYHAGDTIWYDDLPNILLKEKIQLAIVPINGGTEELVRKGFQSNLDYMQAADLCKQIRAERMIPCHFDMFTINTEDPNRFIQYVRQDRDMPEYTLPHIGEVIRIQTGG